MGGAIMDNRTPLTTDAPNALIPPSPVVRERLADNIRERRLLRSLLKLSVKADQVRGDRWPDRAEAVPA